MPKPTKPTPSDLLPRYIVEELQKQDSEALRAVANYAQDLRVYRAVEAKADQSPLDTQHRKQVTVDELTAKAHSKGISDDVADLDTIVEKGVPMKTSIVAKTINDNEYYYFQWREDDRIKSEYIAPVMSK